MILREVITRFRFETKEQDFRAFEGKLSLIKGGLRNIGSLLGISLGIAGVAAIGKMGLSADRAKFNLERLAGINFHSFRSVLSDIQKKFESIRAGASKIFTESDFDTAAANFAKVFGSGKEQAEQFGRIFEFAAKQARLTGGSVVEISKAIQDAIESGGFDALLDIPGFDQQKKKILEFQQQIMNPNEPGGQVGLRNRMAAVFNILKEASAEQDATIRKMPQKILVADNTAKRLEQTLQKAGDAILETVVPAMQKLIQVLDWVIKKLDIVSNTAAKDGITPGEALAFGGKEEQKDYEAKIAARYGGKGGKKMNLSPLGKKLAALLGAGDIDSIGGNERPEPKPDNGPSAGERFMNFMFTESERAYLRSVFMSPGKGGDSGVTVTNNNTFNIKATEPKETAEEVARHMDRQLNDTRNRMTPTERR